MEEQTKTDRANAAQVRGPHQGQPTLHAGEPLAQARAAMVMLHGRGASAEDILLLSEELVGNGLAYLAPRAANNSWYPNSFLAPLASNEPWLSSALSLVQAVLAQVSTAGIPPERTMLLGFSQGACLALEFAARNARRYGGIVGLSGGLVGPNETRRDYAGSFDGTPVFLGCSDTDFHIPKERVLETAEVLKRLGGQVTTKLYPGLGHEVSPEELQLVRQMMLELI